MVPLAARNPRGKPRRARLLPCVFGAVFINAWLPSLLCPQVRRARETDSLVRSSHDWGLPLGPTRVVRFPAVEGTWMSLDVSPDGRWIVFDLLGDLYVLPINGGTARRLTSDMAFNQQPTFSPDGRHLAFISDRSGSPNVWIMDKDGSNARQLSHLRAYSYDEPVASPVWSPDGRTVFVSQKLGAARSGVVDPTHGVRWLLAAYEVTTGQMRWASDTVASQARSILGPAFGPDTSTLYAAVQPFRSYIDLANNWRVERVELVTGQISPEMSVETGRVGMRPAVSPDGRFLVYGSSSGSRTGLRLRDLQTDSERWLVHELLDNPPLNAGAGGDAGDLLPRYSFTPDSQFLIVAYGGKIHRIDLATSESVVIPFVADVERALGPLERRQFTLPDTTTRTQSVMQPACSPDGHWVAFSARDRIWVMELPHDGLPAGRPRRLTADSTNEFYPSWSPDGRWVAYSTWREGEGGAVRRAVFVPSGDVTPPVSERVTADTGLYFHTAVSPDGKRVVAVRAAVPAERVLTHSHHHAPDSLTLVWVPARGGEPHPITALSGIQSQTRSPVEQVYYTADPTRVYVGLSSWRLNGIGEGPLLRVADRETTTGILVDATGVLSPDRRRVLTTHRFTLFELRLPSGMTAGRDAIALEREQRASAGTPAVVAHRWGTALAPWVSWARNGRRVLFNQGGTLFVGDVRNDEWTAFVPVDVQLPVPVTPPHGTLVLHGARLLTMRGHQVIERGDIVVRDNRIAAVGAVGAVALPRCGQVLDVSGTTILPGYVDVHDHMALSDGVHGEQCWQCFVRLAFGVTASHDPWPIPTFYNDIFAYRERERAGELIAPRIFTTGIAHLTTDQPINGMDAARAIMRPVAEYFRAETFKEYNGSAGRRARQFLAMAGQEVGLNATVHGGGAARDLTVVLDGYSGLEHTIPIRIYDDVATLIARSGTIHTQTYGASLGWNYMVRRHGGPWVWPKMRRFVPPSARTWAWPSWTVDRLGSAELEQLLPIVAGAARISAHGGEVAIGSHGDIPGIGYHFELWFHALGGMPNHDILRAATIVGATAIGHANDFGSIEPGKLADLQILDKNPLEDIHNTTSIRYVMKNGRLYDGETLSQRWPRDQPIAPVFLWEPSLPADTTDIAGISPRGAAEECSASQ